MNKNPNQERFYVKGTEIKSEKGWSSTQVEIFDKEQGDIKIGEYIRNYHSDPSKTFLPFKTKDGEWYALYSEKYYATYVMSLPDCTKIAECNTQRPDNKYDTSGLCPYSYYIPTMYALGMTLDGEKKTFWSEWSDEPPESDEVILDWHNPNLAFVLGCYWGDRADIYQIDLSKIKEGILELACPFDPSEVPSKIKNFSDVIDIHNIHTDSNIFAISVNGKFYRYKENSFDVMSDEEEKEWLRECCKKWKEKNEN